MKKINKKINLYHAKRKNVLTIILIIILFLGMLSQLVLFYSEKMNSEDLKYEFIHWSEYCDGRIYSMEEKQTFCDACFNKSGKCEWPLDINISIGKVKRTLNTNGEIHCFFKIDDVNYYTEKGSYYGITESTLFTWELLDASKNHTIEFCCGIERESLMETLFHLEKKGEQGCIIASVPPRC